MQDSNPVTEAEESLASNLLWQSQSAADQGGWVQALHLLQEARALEPMAPVLREFEGEVLVRLGRQVEARTLLEGTPSDHLTEQERWRLFWLSQPGRSASPPREAVLLHPLYGSRRVEHTKLLVVGAIESGVLDQVVEFHRREFAGASISVSRVSEHPALESFEVLRARLEVGADPPWMTSLVEQAELGSPGIKAVLVAAASSQVPTAYSAGFGAPGVVVVSLVPGDPFQATVLAHELYHSLLDLQHTNGYEGPLDLTSIMGPIGLRTPLSHTYVCPEHLRSVTVDGKTQDLVEQERWSEALVLNPSYLGAYIGLAQSLLQQGRAEDAADALKRWFNYDPGPEAAAALGSLLLNLGQDPSPYFFRSRGHGLAANTHLYLAQACLDVCRFEPAVDELERARALEPDNLNVLGMLGWGHHALGNREIAEALYTEAMECCPDWEAIKGRLAWLRSEDYEAPFPDPDLLWLESFARPDAALERLQDEKEPKCLLRRAHLLAQAGREGEAVQVFRECAFADPVGLYGIVANAWVCYLTSPDEAPELLQPALEIWPEETAAQSLSRLLGKSAGRVPSRRNISGNGPHRPTQSC